MQINLNRLITMLNELNQITEEGAGITRPAFSTLEDQAHDWFLNKCREFHLETHQDSFGNSFGTIGKIGKPQETDNVTSEKGILIGSHLDTVKNGGEYDGALGVVTALETAITLLEHKVDLEKPVTVVAFRAEESNPLGGLVGSSVFSDVIDKSEDFDERMKTIGKTAEDVENAVGYVDYSDYLELHIEQGKHLENSHLNIGIVKSIASLNQLDVTVYGEAGHAGTIGMSERNDALMHTAKLLTKFETIVNSYGSPFVGTVGQLEVFPNSSNVIPGKVTFTLEARGDDITQLNQILDTFIEYANQHFRVDIIKSIDKEPAQMSEKIINAIGKSCKINDKSYEIMVSGANHDANPVSRRMNAGMIFIPSKDGISHNPKEFSSTEDIKTGTNVMLETVRQLLE